MLEGLKQQHYKNLIILLNVSILVRVSRVRNQETRKSTEERKRTFSGGVGNETVDMKKERDYWGQKSTEGKEGAWRPC